MHTCIVDREGIPYLTRSMQNCIIEALGRNWLPFHYVPSPSTCNEVNGSPMGGRQLAKSQITIEPVRIRRTTEKAHNPSTLAHIYQLGLYRDQMK